MRHFDTLADRRGRTVGVVTIEDPGGGNGPAAVEFQGITVDLQGLDDFATLMRRETDANLRPYADQIISEQRGGAGFGLSSASEAARLARISYAESLASAYDGLRSYVEASEVLLTSITQVIEFYGNADASAHARGADVEAALSHVAATAARARLDAEALEQQHDTDREMRRLMR